MRPSSRRRVGVAAATVASATALALCAPSAALADSIGGTIPVTATVVSAALVTATPMAFLNYNPTVSGGSAATSTISVTATPGTTYTVGINAGIGSGATVTNRKLTGTSGTLNYGVYTDLAHSNNWGNTTGTMQTGTGNGTIQNFTAYGLIPSGQYATTGAYADTLTVTVTY